jgi:hypothetical protein
MKIDSRLALRLAAAALALALAGCAEERAPRSFVQPNAIKKAELEGTWHYVQTVTEAPVTSSVLFDGLSSELMKIRFDVQENYLYARRAYEQIQGSEDAYLQDPKKYQGQPLAAWRIEKHFDIIRDYNATTGEETNRIIESTERAWNQREFFRVDWSQNVVTDYAGIGLNFFFADGVSVQPSSYWESDPTKPDALHLERADSTDKEFDVGEANYLDITNKMVVTPTMKQLCWEEGGRQECFTIPACYLYYQVDDCASQIAKVRHAFAKISPRHDYEPRNWDGTQMEQFGIWDVGLNRLTYNRQYGVTNTGIQRHAARYNLWQKSYGEDGKPIPYPERKLRTIPYYAESSTGTFPEDLFDTGKEVINQWNKALQVAVKDVQGQLPTQDVLVWCHNPVKVGVDPEACQSNLKAERDARGEIVKGEDGQPIYRARQGDPRRSVIFWVNQQQFSGPLGYGPPLYDVETGETISGQAYIYGAAIDSYSARSRDLVMLLLGKLSSADFIKGVDVQTWVNANRTGSNVMPETHSAEDVKARADAMDFEWAKGLAPEAPINRHTASEFIESLKDRENAIYKSGVFGSNNSNLAQVRRDRLRGGQLEAMMVNADVMAMGGAVPGTDWTTLTASEKLRVSPLRSEAISRAIEERMDKMRAFGVDFADFADENMIQRALSIAKDPSLKDPEEIRKQLRKDIFLGVTLHEVGHNVGLRHNFRASYDAMNYFPKYWELRQKGTQSTRRYVGINYENATVNSVPFAGGDCGDFGKKGTVRARFVDCPGGAISAEEVEGGIHEYTYSSIMDYGSEFNADLQGLGLYDKAAMKFAYAGDGYVEVFTKLKDDPLAQYKLAALHYFQSTLGFPSPLSLIDNLASINYTSYPDLFEGGAAAMYDRVDVPRSEVHTEDLVADGYLRIDKKGRAVVPYYFCSDEFAGNLTCQRYDSGADAYEQSKDLISRYNNYYLLNNFKRDRYTFHSSLAYRNRIAGRYLNPLRGQLTWYVLLRASFTDYFLQSGSPDYTGPFFTDEAGWGGFSLAVSNGFDLFGKILTTPEAGTYRLVSATNSTDYPIAYYKQTSDTIGGTNAIGLLDGKYANTTWDFDRCGYYWADECQSRIGYFIDKTIAFDIMSQSQAYFTGRDTNTDVRKYAIGYYVPFKKQIQEKVGALLAGDYKSFAPYFTSGGKVVNPGWTLNSDGATKTNLIDPAGGFTLQLYAGVYGMSSFPTTFDTSFIETTQIFVVGNGEAPVSDAEILTSGTTDPAALVANGGTKAWFTWQDAVTGKTYAARSYPKVVDNGGGGAYRQDTGARMLETLKTLRDAQSTACVNPNSAQCAARKRAYEQFHQNIDVMRSLHNAFGYASYKTDAPFSY